MQQLGIRVYLTAAAMFITSLLAKSHSFRK